MLRPKLVTSFRLPKVNIYCLSSFFMAIKRHCYFTVCILYYSNHEELVCGHCETDPTMAIVFCHPVPQDLRCCKVQNSLLNSINYEKSNACTHFKVIHKYHLKGSLFHKMVDKCSWGKKKEKKKQQISK